MRTMRAGDIISQIRWTTDWLYDESSGPVAISDPIRFSSRISRLLVIKASHALSERSSWSDMKIRVLRGQCRIEMQDDVIKLSDGMELPIPANRAHRIVAETDFRAVVTFEARA